MSEATRAPELPTRLMEPLVDAIDDALYVVDEGGEMVYWNDQLEETTGYAAAEIAAMDPAALVAPEDREYAPGLGGAVEAPDDGRVTLDVLTTDGEAIPHEFRATTVEDPETGERYRCGIARDVSGRRERERELERLETFVETVADGVYALDEDLEFVYANEQLCRMFGRSRDELLGTDAMELFPSATKAEHARRARREAVDGSESTGRFDVSVPRPDGEDLEVETHYRLHPEPEDDEFRGSVGVIRDVTERNRRRRELARQRALLQGIMNTIPDVVFAFDEEGEPLAEEFLMEEFAGYTRREMRETDPLELIDEDARPAIEEAIAAVLSEGGVVTREAPLVTKEGERVPYEFRASQLRQDGERVGIVGTGRDVSERVRREREVERQRDELATLNRINELIQDITRELLETPSRRDVERTVCQRLAASDLYQFAWVGEPTVDGDRLVARASAGEDDGYVEAVTVRTDDAEAGRGPGGRAWRTGEVCVADVDDEAFEPWRQAAAERDVESVAAIPLAHGETVYGILGVYATRSDAFSEREQAGFHILGETVGFVLNAIKRRKLLFAETVTELELSIASEESLLAGLSAGLDCEVTLEGYVDLGDRWLVYLGIEGTPPEAVVDRLSSARAAGDARVLDDGTESHRVEVEVVDAALLEAPAAAGATIERATASGGETHAVVEIPGDADVRETVDLLTERLPDVTLRAKRERDRGPGRPGLPDGLLDELTDRQREALTVAYRAGYYEWPRESTAEDVARTLDVSTATLHGHLRKAEGRLLAGLIESA